MGANGPRRNEPPLMGPHRPYWAPWALMGLALMGQALMGPLGPSGPGPDRRGPHGLGPHGPPCALLGWALSGQAPIGRALMGWALMGPVGPNGRHPREKKKTSTQYPCPSYLS